MPGDGDFVEGIPARAAETLEHMYRLKAEGYDADRVVERGAQLLGSKREQIRLPGRSKRVVQARSVVRCWCMRELGIRQDALAQMFGISLPAVSTTVGRGKAMADAHGYSPGEAK